MFFKADQYDIYTAMVRVLKMTLHGCSEAGLEPERVGRGLVLSNSAHTTHQTY